MSGRQDLAEGFQIRQGTNSLEALDREQNHSEISLQF